MIVTGNTQQVRQLHVNSFMDATGTFTRSGNEMTCTTAGITAIGSKFAYGTWEFSFNKASGTTINIGIISDIIGKFKETNGYIIFVSTLNQIGLYKTNIGSGENISVSDVNYVSINTSYIIKVVRLKNAGTFKDIGPTVYPANSFALFIKGGAFGVSSWTLIPMAGGVTQNPIVDNTHIISNFNNVDIDAGDKIGNITYKPY